MKKIPFLFCLFTMFSQANAQTRPLDTSVGGAWTNWHREATNVPVLLNPGQKKQIQPKEKICFDKKIYAKATAGSRVLDMYIFINTEDGVVGVLSGREGSLAGGELDIDKERFQFMVISLKGNVYNYYTRKKKNELKHYVSTGNSEAFLYNFSVDGSDRGIFKKTIRNDYCGGKFKTWSYKAEGSAAPTINLFGRTFPNKLISKDYIGANGVGYINTDAGIYVVCEIESAGFSSEMRELEDVDVCFDPSVFIQVENEMVTEGERSLEKQKEKLDNKIISGDCVSEKNAQKNFQKQLIDKKKQTLEKTKQGNVYQNKNTQKAYADLQDPLDVIEGMQYETEVKICQTTKNLSKASGSGAQKLQEKLNCLQTKKTKLSTIKAQMEQINIQYSNDPTKAHFEKTKKLKDGMTGC